MVSSGIVLENSFATGNVSGSGTLGAITGTKTTGTIRNVYYNNHSGNPSKCYSQGDTDCIAI